MLILFSLISFSVLASPERKLNRLLTDLNQVLNSSQLVCDENYARNHLQERACEDLHQAACLDEKGESRYEGKLSSIVDDLEKKLKAKRDEVAKSMYGAPLADAVKKELEKAGVPVDPEVSPYDFSRFMSKPHEYYDMSSILKSSIDCSAKFSIDDLPKLKLNEKQELLKKMVSQVKEESLRVRSASPNFIEEVLNAKNSDCYYNKEDPYCKKAAAIKREALILSRQKKDGDYQEKFNAFFDKYIAQNDIKLSDEASQIDESLSQVIEMGSKQCSLSEAVNSSIARNVASKVVSSVQYSKSFIDFTLNEFYSDEKLKQVQKLFEFSKETMLSNLKGYVNDPAKLKKIEQSYDELKLHWIKKPSDKDYKKDGSNLIFKAEGELSTADNTLKVVFADPSLNYFTDFNANYMPSETLGDVKKDARVDMLPALLKLLETNSMAFLEILGHEVAHKVGPDISRWNGFDLNKDHQQLLACYASPDSIAMRPDQADETMSDYFSSLILAKYVETLPPEKRLDAIIQSVEGYCLFETNYMPDQHTVHPDSYMRISGILGANPKLRELMGCEGDSDKFKTCGVSK